MHAFGTISFSNLTPIFFFSRLKPLIYIGLAFIQQALFMGTHMVRLWDVNMGQFWQEFDGHSRAVRAIAYSPDDKLLE
jgi:hypothetical protein